MLNKILDYKNNSKFENFYIALRTFYLILITLSIFGLGIFSPQVMTNFQIFIKLVISLYLIATFNLFRKKTQIDIKEQAIVYSAGIYLFLSTSVGAFLIQYIKTHDNIKPYLSKIVT